MLKYLTDMNTRRNPPPPWLLLLVAAVVWSGVIVTRIDHLGDSDPDGYRMIAENLRQTGVYGRTLSDETTICPTAYRPPLYPTLLAMTSWSGEVSKWSAALVHIALGIGIVWLTYQCGVKLGLGKWSQIAAGLVVVDPILLNQATLLMTETLGTFLAVLALDTALSWNQNRTGKHAWVLGMAFGLASLSRPTFVVWAGLSVLWCGWLLRDQPRRWWQAVAVGLGVLVVLAPWIGRNAAQFGRPMFATTHGGYTLLLGNNPLYYDHLRAGAWREPWDARHLLPELERIGVREDPNCGTYELDNDQRCYELAQQTMREQPGMVALSSGLRVLRLWSPLPHRLAANESSARRVMRWAVCGWYLLVGSLLVIGLLRLPRGRPGSGWAFIVLACIAFTAVHALYWSNMRMRAPLMPGWYLVVAWGLRSLVDRRKRNSTKELDDASAE